MNTASTLQSGSHRTMHVVARILLSLALVATAALKLDGGPAAARDLQALHIGPGVSLAVAIVELLLAATLLTPRWRAASLATLCFCVLAAGYLLVLRALDIDVRTCGCFGSRRVGLVGHMSLLAGMTIAAAWLLRPRSTDA